MSKNSNTQRIECLRLYLEQLKKGRKYQKPKITMKELVDIKTKYADFEDE